MDFSIDGLRPLVIHMENNEIRTLPQTGHKKINSRWITNLSVKGETVLYLEDNREAALYDIRIKKIS